MWKKNSEEGWSAMPPLELPTKVDLHVRRVTERTSEC